MRIMILLSVTLLTLGCGEDPESNTLDSANDDGAMALEPMQQIRIEASGTMDEAIAAATEAIETASDAGYLWSTSVQLLKDAKAAAVDGDEANAISLADEARLHVKLAEAQASRETREWRNAVISE